MRTTSTFWVGAAVAAALAVFAPAAAQAQKPQSAAAVISETFTIDSIDHTARMVTLKDKDGNLTEVLCGPEVQRFDALKVGDRVTFRYHESLVTAVRKSAGPPKAGQTAAITRAPGSKPGGTVSQQYTATVTIEAIDPKVPSVTIKTADGRKSSFKVEDKKYLEGLKAGDNVDITYTQALAVSVAPAK